MDTAPSPQELRLGHGERVLPVPCSMGSRDTVWGAAEALEWGQQLLPLLCAWALFLCQRRVLGHHPGSLRSHGTGVVMCPGWAVTGCCRHKDVWLHECCISAPCVSAVVLSTL